MISSRQSAVAVPRQAEDAAPRRGHPVALALGPAIFLVVGLLAAAERPFHGDEYVWLPILGNSLWDIVRDIFFFDIHPPLSYLIGHFATVVTSPFLSSIPPLALFAAALGWFIAASHRHLGLQEVPAWLYSAAVGLHPSLVTFLFTTRYYSYLAVFLTLASALLVEFLATDGRWRGSRSALLGIGVCVILGLWCSPVANAYTLAILLVYFTVGGRRHLGAFAAVVVVYALALIPVVVQLRTEGVFVKGMQYQSWNTSTDWQLLGVYDLFVGTTIPVWNFAEVGLAIAFLAGLGALVVARRKALWAACRQPIFAALLVILVVSILVGFGTKTMARARVFAYVLPVLSAIILYTIVVATREWRRTRYAFLGALLLLNVIGVKNLLRHETFDLGWYNYPEKLRREVSAVVAAEKPDAVIFDVRGEEEQSTVFPPVIQYLRRGDLQDMEFRILSRTRFRAWDRALPVQWSELATRRRLLVIRPAGMADGAEPYPGWRVVWRRPLVPYEGGALRARIVSESRGEHRYDALCLERI